MGHRIPLLKAMLIKSNGCHGRFSPSHMRSSLEIRMGQVTGIMSSEPREGEQYRSSGHRAILLQYLRCRVTPSLRLEGQVALGPPDFLVSPRTKISQPLWATRFSVGQPRGEVVFPVSSQNSPCAPLYLASPPIIVHLWKELGSTVSITSQEVVGESSNIPLSFLSAEPAQFSQPLPFHHVCRPSDRPGGSLLGALQYVRVLLVLGSAELGTAPQKGLRSAEQRRKKTLALPCWPHSW